MNHLESTGGGEGGEAVAAEELAGRDAHHGRRALGTLGQDGVPHGLVDPFRVLDRDRLFQLLVDLPDQGRPVRPQIERLRLRRLRRGRGGGGAADWDCGPEVKGFPREAEGG